jgi:hypothetical protein
MSKDQLTPETTSARHVNHMIESLPRYVVDVEVCERIERERDQWARTASALDISRLKLQRQKDDYAESLSLISKGHYCGGVATFIYTKHPELAL